MKKVEAAALALEKSKIIIDNIVQILSISEKVNAYMNFVSVKINNINTCVLDIYIPDRKFEKHLNLEITCDHYLVLYTRLLNDLLDIFLEHETIGVTRYYSIKSMQENFAGINAVNKLGSKIKINLNSSGLEFNNLISEYTRRYDEFEKSLEQEYKIKI